MQLLQSSSPPLSEDHPSALNILSVEAFRESGNRRASFFVSNW
jgi:hypothetical protein